MTAGSKEAAVRGRESQCDGKESTNSALQGKVRVDADMLRGRFMRVFSVSPRPLQGAVTPEGVNLFTEVAPVHIWCTRGFRPSACQGVKHALTFGVDDGTRTRDSQNHNLVLYQLNYAHHRFRVSGTRDLL